MGSVKAQYLLFEHSDFGDIRPLFSGYYDTKVGGKKEQASYENILSQIPFSANEVVFLSDVLEELDAAKAAGMHTLQLWRNDRSRSDTHPFI